jgi:type I restriction enzyme S subunit
VESHPELTSGRYGKSITFITLKIKSYPQVKIMSKLLEQINNTKTTKRLGNLVLINQSTINSDFPYKEIEYIDTASVTKNHFEKPQILNTVEAPSRAKRLLKDGDTILSTVRPNLRHYGFIKTPKPNTVASTGFVVLTPKSIDPFYLYSYLTQDSITDTLSSIAEATTTTFPAFRPEVLSEMEIEIPDLPTQKKIAEILSAYDSKIENNNKIIKNLEATAQTIFNKWFINFCFPGYEKAKIVDSEMGEIPEGWEVLKLGDILNIKYGKNLPTSKISSHGKFPVYGAGGVIGFYEEKNVDEKVILITCRGNGSGTIWRTNGEGFVTNNSFLILPKNNYNYINFVSIYFLLKNSNISSALSGSAQPQITIDGLSPLETILPSKKLLIDFQNSTTTMFGLVDRLLEENISLKQSRDQLLAKLI